MSSFLCFLCHSTVNADTNEDMREKYKEVVGMHLCLDSHLCYICCHVLNKLWLFRAVCLKRSLEYPVLFTEKGTLNLQRNELELLTICSENCHQFHNRRVYSKSGIFHCEHTVTSQEGVDNDYVEFQEYFQQDNVITNNNKETQENNDNQYLNYNEDSPKHDENNSFTQDGEEIESKDFNEDNHGSVESNCNYDIQNAGITNENEDTINQDEYSDVQTNYIEEDNIIDSETHEINPEINSTEKEESIDIKKKKTKKGKKKGYEKIVLTLEQQKKDIERKRKDKKYIEAEFKCYSCAAGFLFKDTYQTHMMRHEESNGEHRCMLCSLRFASLPVLRSHMAGHAQRHLCLKCGTTIMPRARNTHAKKCWKRNTDVASCHLCAAMFSDFSGLQQHLKRFHRYKRTHSRNSICSICGHSYANSAALRTHMIKHINRKFDCDQCSSTFSSPYTLSQHKKKHDGTRSEQYYCEVCNVSYCSKKSLLAHKRNALNHQQSFFECPICTRQCPNQRSLASHIESIHSGTKNYVCPHCNARYSNRKSLVRHIGSHTARKDIKKVICHLCGASYKGNNKLNRHLREVCFRKRIEESIEYGQDCMNPT